MTRLGEALMYLDMGWAVYPAHSVDLESGLCSCGREDCPCPGKHPVGRWTDYQNRLPTRQEVRAWFSSTDFNVGTVTGQVSGIAVVDVDGEAGIESARRLELKPTLTARTGGGGYHLFYSLRHPIRSRVRAADGIDLRADGGYVVLAPSLHKSGRHYEWLEPRPIEPFDAALNASLCLHAYAKPINWSGEILQGVAEGERSMSAARLAGRYFGLGLSLDEVWILVSSWNQRNIPPMNEGELRRSVEAIHRKHMEVARPVQIQTLEELRSILAGNGV